MVDFRINVIIDSRNAATGVTVIERRLASLQRRASSLGGAFGRLGGVLAAAFTFRAVQEQIDGYIALQNRLAAVTREGEDLAKVQNDLLQVSNRSRSSLQEVVRIYSRLSTGAKTLGVSQAELIDFTETLSKTIAISGATSYEAAGALTQFSQAMASGALRGDELRSVLEQLPEVANVIAKRFGVTAPQLAVLGKRGLITSQQIIGAFRDARKEIEDRFGKTVPTIAQSFTILKNQVLVAFGEIDKATGISTGFNKILILLAENTRFFVAQMQLAARAISETGGVGSDAFEGLDRTIKVIASVVAGIFQGIVQGVQDAVRLFQELTGNTAELPLLEIREVTAEIIKWVTYLVLFNTTISFVLGAVTRLLSPLLVIGRALGVMGRTLGTVFGIMKQLPGAAMKVAGALRVVSNAVVAISSGLLNVLLSMGRIAVLSATSLAKGLWNLPTTIRNAVIATQMWYQLLVLTNPVVAQILLTFTKIVVTIARIGAQIAVIYFALNQMFSAATGVSVTFEETIDIIWESLKFIGSAFVETFKLIGMTVANGFAAVIGNVAALILLPIEVLTTGFDSLFSGIISSLEFFGAISTEQADSLRNSFGRVNKFISETRENAANFEFFSQEDFNKQIALLIELEETTDATIQAMGAAIIKRGEADQARAEAEAQRMKAEEEKNKAAAEEAERQRQQAEAAAAQAQRDAEAAMAQLKREQDEERRRLQEQMAKRPDIFGTRGAAPPGAAIDDPSQGISFDQADKYADLLISLERIVAVEATRITQGNLVAAQLDAELDLRQQGVDLQADLQRAILSGDQVLANEARNRINELNLFIQLSEDAKEASRIVEQLDVTRKLVDEQRVLNGLLAAQPKLQQQIGKELQANKIAQAAGVGTDQVKSLLDELDVKQQLIEQEKLLNAVKAERADLEAKINEKLLANKVAQTTGGDVGRIESLLDELNTKRQLVEEERVLQALLDARPDLYDEINKKLVENSIAQKEMINEFGAGVEAALKKAMQMAEDFNAFGQNAFLSFVNTSSDALTEFVIEGKANFKDFALSFLRDITRMIAQALILQSIKAGLGLAGVDTTALFGGGKAAGGPVRSDRTYLVGEKGPEIFQPNTNGNIIPNNKITVGGEPAAPPQVNLQVVNVDDPRKVPQAISSGSSDQAILNVLQRNREAVRRTLG